MTKAEIEAVLDRVRTWPEDRQAYAAYMLRGLEEAGAGPLALNEEDEAALDEAELEVERGEVASEADIETVLTRLRGR